MAAVLEKEDSRDKPGVADADMGGWTALGVVGVFVSISQMRLLGAGRWESTRLATVQVSCRYYRPSIRGHPCPSRCE